MKKILGIDFGTKDIGLAITDPFNRYALPYSVIKNTNNFIDELKEIIELENIGTIVVGFPCTINNYVSERHKLILDFISFLKKSISSVNIDVIDESYTTSIAISNQKNFLVKKSKIKKTKDMLSAALILESYLKKNSNSLL